MWFAIKVLAAFFGAAIALAVLSVLMDCVAEWVFHKAVDLLWKVVDKLKE